MQRNGKGSFAFFISPAKKTEGEEIIQDDEKRKKSEDTLSVSVFTFGFAKKDLPYIKEINLFGSMTLDECKVLATILYQKFGRKIALPENFDHPRFHVEPLKLSFGVLQQSFLNCFGLGSEAGLPPPRSKLSMEGFFDYLLRVRSSLEPYRSGKKSSTPD